MVGVSGVWLQARFRSLGFSVGTCNHTHTHMSKYTECAIRQKMKKMTFDKKRSVPRPPSRELTLKIPLAVAPPLPLPLPPCYISVAPRGAMNGALIPIVYLLTTPEKAGALLPKPRRPLCARGGPDPAQPLATGRRRDGGRLWTTLRGTRQRQ